MKFIITAVALLAVLSLAPTAQAQNMHAGGQVGLALPMGSFADVANMGFGLQGNFLYELQPKLWLTGSLGYYTFGYETSPLYTDASMSTVPLEAGIRYEIGQGTVTPYIGANLGLHFMSTTIKYTGFFATEISDSDTNLGLTPVLGILYPLSPNLMLDANLRYNIVFTDVENTTWLGVYAGVIVPIN